MDALVDQLVLGDSQFRWRRKRLHEVVFQPLGGRSGVSDRGRRIR